MSTKNTLLTLLAIVIFGFVVISFLISFALIHTIKNA
jgi:hypothetical protein